MEMNGPRGGDFADDLTTLTHVSPDISKVIFRTSRLSNLINYLAEVRDNRNLREPFDLHAQATGSCLALLPMFQQDRNPLFDIASGFPFPQVLRLGHSGTRSCASSDVYATCFVGLVSSSDENPAVSIMHHPPHEVQDPTVRSASSPTTVIRQQRASSTVNSQFDGSFKLVLQRWRGRCAEVVARLLDVQGPGLSGLVGIVRKKPLPTQARCTPPPGDGRDSVVPSGAAGPGRAGERGCPKQLRRTRK